MAFARLSALASAGVNGSVRADRSVLGSVSWTWPPTDTRLCAMVSVPAELSAVVVLNTSGEHHDRVDQGPDADTQQDRKADKAEQRRHVEGLHLIGMLCEDVVEGDGLQGAALDDVE